MYGYGLGIRLIMLHPAWLWLSFEYGFLLVGAVCSATLELVLWFGVRQRSMRGNGVAFYVGTAFSLSTFLFGAVAAMLLAISSWASPVGFALIAAVIVVVEIGSWWRAKLLDMPAIFIKAKRKKVLVPDGDGWVFNLWDTDLLTVGYKSETLLSKMYRYWLPVAALLLIPAANIQIYSEHNLDLTAGIAAVLCLALGVASQNGTYFVHATRALFAEVRKQS